MSDAKAGKISAESAIGEAVARVDAEKGVGGLQSGRRREAALLDGLEAWAALNGRAIAFGYRAIDANGEFCFQIANQHGALGRTKFEGWGVGMAADLGRVPTRCGQTAGQTNVLPENSWTRLNHFDAERLLRLVAADLALGRREAMSLVHAVAAEMGAFVHGWRVQAAEIPGDWAHTELVHYGVRQSDRDGFSVPRPLPIGVSGGGIVSVEGDPFTPGDRAPNDTLDAVRQSITTVLVRWGWTQTGALAEPLPSEESPRVMP